MRNAVRFGIPETEAICAATILPAGVIGEAQKSGSIEEGKYADFLVCDRELNLLEVYLGGKRLR